MVILNPLKIKAGDDFIQPNAGNDFVDGGAGNSKKLFILILDTISFADRPYGIYSVVFSLSTNSF